MNRFASWVRRLAIVFLLGITCVGLQFGSVVSPAQAETVTPEAKSYQTQQHKNTEDLSQKTNNNLKEAAKNVREKLNLDEPLDPGTKQVLDSTKIKADQIVESIKPKK